MWIRRVAKVAVAISFVASAETAGVTAILRRIRDAIFSTGTANPSPTAAPGLERWLRHSVYLEQLGGQEKEHLTMRAEEWHLVSGAVSMRGRRPTDEDTVVVVAAIHSHKNIRIQALFDGHGGPNVAQFAANRLQSLFARQKGYSRRDLEKICHNLDQELKKNNVRRGGATGVIMVIEKVEKPEKVIVRGRQILKDPGLPPLKEQYRRQASPAEEITLGTSEAPFRLHIANVGDSRAMLVLEDEYYEMTKDHKPDDPEEKSRILRAGAVVTSSEGTSVSRINGSLALSRSFGDFSLKQGSGSTPDAVISTPDVRQFYAGYNDLLILFCDGVTEPAASSWPQVAAYTREIFAQTSDVVKTAVALAEQAYEAGSQDNLSAVVTRLRPEPAEDPAATLHAYAWMRGILRTVHTEDWSHRLDTAKSDFFLPLF
ncbi:UNVERIFIED_CONTAM: protein phosphatase 2C domain-containing protein [Hammondia hammondi]|eukprot:XP_008887123.1 protein phosphatase 2C domain-containing protein [Hammondia hammondi]